MNIEYYFKLGNIESNKKPNSPTLDNVKNWYRGFLTHDSSKDYDIYLVGSFAEKEFGIYDGKPYDVDVVLVGDIKDESTLLSLLEHGIRCGFNNDVMIDIWHNDKLMNLKIKKQFIQTRSYDTFISKIKTEWTDTTNTIKLWNGDGVKLESGLYQYTYPEDNNSRSWEKANKRLVDGDYMGLQIKIKDII